MSWFGFLLLMWWKHTFSCTSLVLVNTHRPHFEAHAHSQRLVGMEQTGDDGKSDSFHTSKICWAQPSVAGAIATPLEMSGKLPRFPCEWLFSLNTTWTGVPQTSGCKLSDINLLYLFRFFLLSPWITESLWELTHLFFQIGHGYLCRPVWPSVVQKSSTSHQMMKMKAWGWPVEADGGELGQGHVRVHFHRHGKAVKYSTLQTVLEQHRQFICFCCTLKILGL